MTTHDLAPFVTAFFTRHLPAERKASPNTIVAYRDTLKLLLRFLAASMHRTAAALHVEDLSPDRILDFLEDLETTRRNTIRTRNARLAAIHSFFRYVLDTEPALAQIDRSTQVGERDYLLVALLYDTGARIQELLNLAPCDVRFAPPLFVRLFGKGGGEGVIGHLGLRSVPAVLVTAGLADPTTRTPCTSRPNCTTRPVDPQWKTAQRSVSTTMGSKYGPGYTSSHARRNV